MAADDERRPPDARRAPRLTGDTGSRGDSEASGRAERPNIDRIADKVKGLLRSRD